MEIYNIFENLIDIILLLWLIIHKCNDRRGEISVAFLSCVGETRSLNVGLGSDSSSTVHAG